MSHHGARMERCGRRSDGITRLAPIRAAHAIRNASDNVSGTSWSIHVQAKYAAQPIALLHGHGNRWADQAYARANTVSEISASKVPTHACRSEERRVGKEWR